MNKSRDNSPGLKNSNCSVNSSYSNIKSPSPISNATYKYQSKKSDTNRSNTPLTYSKPNAYKGVNKSNSINKNSVSVEKTSVYKSDSSLIEKKRKLNEYAKDPAYPEKSYISKTSVKNDDEVKVVKVEREKLKDYDQNNNYKKVNSSRNNSNK